MTSNQSFGAWGEVFGDRIIATAILDRVLHHAITITVRGNSYRFKEKLKAGLLRAEETTAYNRGGIFQLPQMGKFGLPLTRTCAMCSPVSGPRLGARRLPEPPPAMGVVSLEGGKTGQRGVKSDLKTANPA
jgi:hypothetical protein